MKTCPDCGEEKPLEDFYQSGNRSTRRCRPCHSIRSSVYAKARRKNGTTSETIRESNRAYQRWYRYGLTEVQYKQILDKFDSRCYLCGDGESTLCVDHDHSCCPGIRTCGKCIRGILCAFCNHGLGRFRDNPALLRAAADYLERPPHVPQE